MNRFLRRHRWNLVSAIGLVLLMWVGPYVLWRMESYSFELLGRTYRFVCLPAKAPESAVMIFRPLGRIDHWLTGDGITVRAGKVFSVY